MSAAIPPNPPCAPAPTPRQLLTAAQLLAMGESLSHAALMADLHLPVLRSLQADPDFVELLADGRVGAVTAAMRLLGLMPSRACGRDEAESLDPSFIPDPDPPLLAEAERRWGIRPDAEGGWVAGDGKPVMPGRNMLVVPGKDGPIRLLDPERLPFHTVSLAQMHEGLTPEENVLFNRSTVELGEGTMWDPVARTLWPWASPPRSRRAPPTPERCAALPPSLPAPALLAHDDLDRRLRGLLACGEPADAGETDLAEAVCALLWPHWPPYEGGLDLAGLRRLLDRTPIPPELLTRLGAAGGAPTARPPPALAA